MRRAMAVLVSVATIVGMVAGPVFADSGPTRTVSGLTVRADPNEKNVRELDIRRVMTHLGTDEVLLRIGIWRQGGFRGLVSIEFDLDGRGSSDFDYKVFMSARDCVVQRANASSTLLGEIRTRHPGPRDVLCRFPRTWVTIDKPVRFVVKAFSVESHDRAPNRGDYFGL